ncbi:unnamed protein product, partial [Heterosigma akashiwo]
MLARRLRLREAFLYAQSCRQAIDPNGGFRAQLLMLEKEIFGDVSMTEEELATLGNQYVEVARSPPGGGG